MVMLNDIYMGMEYRYATYGFISFPMRFWNLAITKRLVMLPESIYDDSNDTTP